MIKLHTQAFIICFLLMFGQHSICQSDKDLIIWDFNNNFLVHKRNVDSLTILNVVANQNLKKGWVYYIYWGSQILKPATYKFPYDLCNCSWTIEEGWDLSTFLMYDSLLDSHDSWKDTTSYKRHDALSDGLWMRTVIDSNGVFCQAQKNIKNGVLHGPYIQWWENRNLWNKEKYINGWETDASYVYYPEGLLSVKTIFNSNHRIEERIGYSASGAISWYYNSKLRASLYFYPNGILSSIRQTKNGIPHGVERFYNEKGRLYLRKQWKSGEVIRTNRNFLIRRPHTD